MNERDRARQVLRDAKQILSQRLVERVTELADEILADARGDSYMNEIETVYEHVGTKLAHVNQMLSNLPAEAPPPEPTARRAKSAPQARATLAANAMIVATTSPAIPAGLPAPIRVDLRALPPPKPKAIAGAFAPHRALSAFAAQVQIGNLRAAGHTLAVLFGLDEPRAIVCVAVFAERMASDPDFFRRAAQLRIELQTGGYQRVHSLLFECFGLRPSEAFAILKGWRRQTPLGS